MNYRHFSIEEREKIQELLWAKVSIRTIAQSLQRSPSSVAREIRRNKPPERNVYTPRVAHERALLHRTHRGRSLRLKNEHVRAYVIDHLKQRWSPEQIAGRLKLEFQESISHEAIYRFIYHQISPASGLVKTGQEDLRLYLRRRRKIRLPHGARKCQRILRPHGPSIDLRPLVVDRRARVGDWEGDTVESVCHRPGVNTLVERKTGLVCITKLRGKTSAATVEAMSTRMETIPSKFKLTVTLDNGPENSDWNAIERSTGVQCFFAHPYHSWERPTNENTNGLIRDYFPKKTDFTIIPDAEIQKVEYDLNTRPRKRLGYKTPLEVWSVALRS